ncbi:hypothetical protein ACJX0J_041991, partial [Zea mays]
MMTPRSLLALLALAVCCLPAAARVKRYRVGGKEGWRVPPLEDKEKYYDNWASNITFYNDDILEFVFKNDSVQLVSYSGYRHCDETWYLAPHDGKISFFLSGGPRYLYFASSNLVHCRLGQHLAINVHVAAPHSVTNDPVVSSSSAPAVANVSVIALALLAAMAFFSFGGLE